MAGFSALCSAWIGLALGASAMAARAQSLAASLSGYAATLKVSSVAGVSAKSFSGVALHRGQNGDSKYRKASEMEFTRSIESGVIEIEICS